MATAASATADIADGARQDACVVVWYAVGPDNRAIKVLS